MKNKILLIAVFLILFAGTAKAIWPWYVGSALVHAAGAYLFFSDDASEENGGSGGSVPSSSPIKVKLPPLTQQEIDLINNGLPPQTVTELALTGYVNLGPSPAYVFTEEATFDAICQTLGNNAATYWEGTGIYNNVSASVNFASDTYCDISLSHDNGTIAASATFTVVSSTSECPPEAPNYNDQVGRCYADQTPADGTGEVVRAPDGSFLENPNDADLVPPTVLITPNSVSSTQSLSAGGVVTSEINRDPTEPQYVDVVNTQADIPVLHPDGTTTTTTIIDTATIDSNGDVISSTHDYVAADGSVESPFDELLNTGSGTTSGGTSGSTSGGGTGSGNGGGIVGIDETGTPTGTDDMFGAVDTGQESLIAGLVNNTAVDQLTFAPDMPSYSSCQTINLGSGSNMITFPNPGQCSKLEAIKSMLGWFFYVITAFVLFNIGTRRLS